MSSTELVFRVGNTKVIVMENYEALGRYIAAKEQAEKFTQERQTALARLASLIGTAMGSSSSSYLATDFNVQAAQELLTKVGEAHQNMLVAMQEANNHAEACGKPKLQIWKI